MKIFYYCDHYAAWQSIGNDDVNEYGYNEEERQKFIANYGDMQSKEYLEQEQ